MPKRSGRLEIKNMEQKRRTMSTTGAREKKGKKVWKVLGVIVALGLIFFLSYKISYGLLSDGSNPSTDATQSTEEDIASMTREELEKSYKDAKKQLEEKDAEIEMLKEKVSKGDSTTATPSESSKPSETSKPAESSKPSETTKPQETKKTTETPKSTPSHTTAPSTGNSTPQTPPPATKAPSDQLMTPDDLANLPGASGN